MNRRPKYRISLLLPLLSALTAPLAAQELNGFVEFGFAPKFTTNRLVQGPDGNTNGQSYALGEQRIQLKYEHSSEAGELFFKLDFLNDNVLRTSDMLVREAYFSSTPFEWADVKIGRQIQTWGVGDLMFINDVFAKDWISFFSGRNDEYLKAPNDAIRVSLFPEWAGIEAIDISFMPFSQPDINPQTQGRFASQNPIFPFMQENGARIGPIQETSFAFKNFELAARVQLQPVSGFTTALYAYRGRWKNPNALAAAPGGALTPFFSKLAVFGASTRGQAIGGIISLEGGYYLSRDDSDGRNPLLENSSLRYLALYERPIVPNLDIGLQYYGELIQDYWAIGSNMQAFFANPAGVIMDKDGLRDEFRHLLSLRVTRKLKNETLWLTWFSYFSPSDQDFYFRPKIAYAYSDNIRFIVTANIFGAYGDNNDEQNVAGGFIPDHHNTLFAQFKDDSNLNFTFRYIF